MNWDSLTECVRDVVIALVVSYTLIRLAELILR